MPIIEINLNNRSLYLNMDKRSLVDKVLEKKIKWGSPLWIILDGWTQEGYLVCSGLFDKLTLTGSIEITDSLYLTGGSLFIVEDDVEMKSVTRIDMTEKHDYHDDLENIQNALKKLDIELTPNLNKHINSTYERWLILEKKTKD